MKKVLPSSHRKDLLATLHSRFQAHPERHPNIGWDDVLTRLEAYPDKLWSLHEMELTGSEPDVTGLDPDTGACRFVDCSAQTPSGRTSVCYDRAGLESRKEHKPRTSAMDQATEMGIDLLTTGRNLTMPSGASVANSMSDRPTAKPSPWNPSPTTTSSFRTISRGVRRI